MIIKPEWAMVILTAIYVGATISYVRIAYRTLGRIEEQIKLAKDSVAIAKESADAAVQNTEMMISKERARVLLQHVHPFNPASDRISFKFFCYGPTNAFTDSARVRAFMSDSFDPEPPATLLPLTNFPRVVEPTRTTDGIQGSVLIFDEIDPGRINRREQFLHLFGKITYKDIFDRGRESTFHYIWLVTPGGKLDGSPLRRWHQCETEGHNKET